MANDSETEEKASVDWTATFAGAASAVTAAVLLSTLGAAGTLIGAALGSVVATVATALYKNGIRASKRQVAAVQAAALQKVGLAQDDVRRAADRAEQDPAAADLARAEINLQGAADELAPEESTSAAAEDADRAGDSGSESEAPTPQDPVATGWRALPWRRIAIGSAGVFLIAMLAISAFELIAGQSVSSITGGTDGTDRTSIGGVIGNSDTDQDRDQQRRDQQREQEQDEGDETTDEASPNAPSDQATEQPSDATSESTTPTESTTQPSETGSASPFDEGSTAPPEATPSSP